MVPRVVIAGTGSGVGKTTVTVGLARALRRRGLRVAMFKCGPDYLDPTYHQRAADSPSHNLDAWMMGRDAAVATFVRASRGADIALVEGMMGLYDGATPIGEEGSTAEMAKWLEAPVLLVVDASGLVRTLAALVSGVVSFDAELRVAGVICNRVGGSFHLDLLRTAQTTPPVLGGLTTTTELAFPERHLGLRSADFDTVPEPLFDEWGQRAARELDVDGIIKIARTAPALASPGAASPATAVRRAPVHEGGTPSPLSPARPCRIGVARDEAFHFYYEDNLRRLEAAGAELVWFSPLRDQRLPPVHGLYLGGGYPEAHAQALANNDGMRADIRAFATTGHPIYGECGGMMYLAAAIWTADGRRHEMVGLLSSEALVADKLQAIGYVEVELQRSTFLGPTGTRFRGHQFRYSRLARETDATPDDCAYAVRPRYGGAPFDEGYQRRNVLGSYVHAHWASNPSMAGAFVAACGSGGAEKS